MPYWMTLSQAQQVLKMAPQQIGSLFGLPADTARKLITDGLDFDVITPKSGEIPTIFESNIANVDQGRLSLPGGAKQVIVPNRARWTDAEKVSEDRLKQLIKGVNK